MNYGANHIAVGGWFCIQSETFYVEHNADGTKSISVSSSLSTSDFNPHTTGASGDITLTTIPRATACPNLDGYIESSAPISLNPASTTFKHRIYYSYNGKTGYYPSSSGFFSNSGSLPLDTSFYSYTSSSSGTGSITLYTYDSNGNQIGSKTGSITIRCDKDKCKPIISMSVIDSNSTTTSLTGDSSKLIKGYSNAKITYTITTRNSASLKSKTLNGGSLGDSPYTISSISTNSFSIYAIDSRGFDTTETKTNTMVDYIPLTLDFDAYRPSSTGSEIKISFQGNYFDASFGSVSNSLSLSWKYRKKGDSDWKDGGTFEINTHYKVSNNKYYSVSDISLGTIFDYQTNYEVCVFYKDELINTSIIKTVPKGQPVLSWEDELVNVYGSLTINDIKVIESGSNNRGSWIKFCDGTMICRGQASLSGITFTQWATGLNYSSQQGLSFPQSFINDDIGMSVTCRSSNFAWASNVVPTANDFVFYILHTTNIERTIFVTWTAIGRWK